MEIIIDKKDYASYGDSTYKGFYDFFSKELKINQLNYDTDILRDFLWENRFLNLAFIFIGFNLSDIIACKSYDDVKWKGILSSINDMVITFPNNTLTFQDCIGEFVTEIIIDRANYKDYGYYTFKGFYEDVFRILDGKHFIDFEDLENCCYHADILNEFLWYNHTKNIKFIFVDFDVEKIKTTKTFDCYEWGLIIDVVSDFVKKFPNNTLEFKSSD